jgi:hypothetical protein
MEIGSTSQVAALMQIEVAKKQLETARDQGKAAVQLIESSGGNSANQPRKVEPGFHTVA